MQTTHTTDQIADLTLLINSLETKQDQLTDEEHNLLSPIFKAAQPLLDSLEDALMDAFEDEEEDWSDI